MSTIMTYDDPYTAQLAPDTLMPSQFVDRLRRKEMDGERRLMLAVLEDAIHCFQKQLHATEAKHQALFRDAEEWIMSDDTSWFFSFVNVCDTLDLNPHWVREGLLRWREREHAAAATARHERPAPASADPGEGAEPPLRQASGG